MATEVATWVEREERRSKRIATEQTVLEQRFASPATGSTRTGELFRTTLRRLRLSRERLARTELPAIDDRLQWVQQRRAEVQERLYEVEPTLLEDNSAWLELEAALGDVDDEQRDRAQIVLRKQLFGADGLVGALNAHVNDLEALQADLATVESKAFGRRDALDDVIAYLNAMARRKLAPEGEPPASATLDTTPPAESPTPATSGATPPMETP